jgi:hypothetical protein
MPDVKHQGSTNLQNNEHLIPSSAVQHHTRLDSSTTLLSELDILQYKTKFQSVTTAYILV